MTWRDRSTHNAHVANSVLTHLYALCEQAGFRFGGDSGCVADVLELGHLNDGDDAVSPEHFKKLYRFARGELGQRPMLENISTFANGWIQLNGTIVEHLVSAFADGNESDPKAMYRSVQMCLEAVSWNDVLGIPSPPIRCKVKEHGNWWGLRFMDASPCLKGRERINEQLPPIPEGSSGSDTSAGASPRRPGPEPAPASAPEEQSSVSAKDPLAAAGFPT